MIDLDTWLDLGLREEAHSRPLSGFKIHVNFYPSVMVNNDTHFMVWVVVRRGNILGIFPYDKLDAANAAAITLRLLSS